MSTFNDVRQFSEQLAAPLEVEDFCIQSMPDVSPTKWHLAHTTWFFETFLLAEADPSYQSFHPEFGFLFNSYYNAVGDRHARPQRGLLSRPTVATVFAYREHVDAAVCGAIDNGLDEALRKVLDIGLHHEQQHQELMLMDLKHVFSVNPLKPPYREAPRLERCAPPLSWIGYDEGIREIGRDLGEGFLFDNESPRHRVFLEAFVLGSRLVTNAEYLAFIDDGAYDRAALWLSEGWDFVNQRGWRAPLYWEQRDGEWWHYTLGGMRSVDPNEPVVHLSYFEADAFARWADARLPTEAEWEVAASGVAPAGNFVEGGYDHPIPAERDPSDAPLQLFGDVWEWTQSPYVAYPGFRPLPGALGEYNGKFMCNQMVLRGGCCATSISHIRRSYRNFFAPHSRWPFCGLRLAKDAAR